MYWASVCPAISSPHGRSFTPSRYSTVSPTNSNFTSPHHPLFITCRLPPDLSSFFAACCCFSRASIAHIRFASNRDIGKKRTKASTHSLTRSFSALVTGAILSRQIRTEIQYYKSWSSCDPLSDHTLVLCQESALSNRDSPDVRLRPLSHPCAERQTTLAAASSDCLLITFVLRLRCRFDHWRPLA